MSGVHARSADARNPTALQQANPLAAPTPRPTLSPFGVSSAGSIRLGEWEPEDISAAQLAVNAGIRWERTSVDWRNVEKTEDGVLDWSYFDAHIQTLVDRGLAPYVLIMNNPSWAATWTDPKDNMTKPLPCGPVREDKRGQFAEFVETLVERYDGDDDPDGQVHPEVLLWGLYNEPDNAKYSENPEKFDWGGCFGEDDDIDGNGIEDYIDYAEMARIAWLAVQRGNPNARLVIGGVSHDNFTDDTAPKGYPDDSPNSNCCFNYRFVGNLFKYLGENQLSDGKYGDIFAFNSYWRYLEYWESLNSAKGPAAKAAAIKKKMKDNGLNFPMLIGEIGSPAPDPPNDALELRLQARRLVQMYVQALGGKVLAAFWWPFADFPPSENLDKGLVRFDLTIKPSYTAYKVMTSQLSGYKFKKKFSGVSGVEGYTFAGSGGSKTVLWASDENDTVNVPFAAHELRVMKMLGGKNKKYKSAAGTITVKVGADPVYVTIVKK